MYRRSFPSKASTQENPSYSVLYPIEIKMHEVKWTRVRKAISREKMEVMKLLIRFASEDLKT